MAVLPIRLFPDFVLRQKSKPVPKIDGDIQEFIKDLLETMYSQPSGIGIAAPQVGKPKRIIVVDVSPRDPNKGQEIMINPVILRSEGQIVTREGCMSLPDYTASLLRAERIWVRWYDLAGKRHERSAKGIEAVCIQHEVDHLNGVLFIDRVASLRTDVFPRARRR